MITSLGFKAKLRPYKYKKARYAIGNVSKKDLLNIIKEFEKLPYESYDKKRTKHEPTDSYFYLARQLARCMMIYNTFNPHVYPVRMKMNSTSSHVCSTDEEKSKRHHRAQNFIAELFYGRGRIKTQNHQRNFIAELFRGRGRIKFYG